MNTTNIFSEMQMMASAQRFLNIADKFKDSVSNYFNGSNDLDDEKAYNLVKSYEKDFLNKYNAYYNESIVPALNYEIAESVLSDDENIIKESLVIHALIELECFYSPDMICDVLAKLENLYTIEDITEVYNKYKVQYLEING